MGNPSSWHPYLGILGYLGYFRVGIFPSPVAIWKPKFLTTPVVGFLVLLQRACVEEHSDLEKEMGLAVSAKRWIITGRQRAPVNTCQPQGLNLGHLPTV